MDKRFENTKREGRPAPEYRNGTMRARRERGGRQRGVSWEPERHLVRILALLALFSAAAPVLTGCPGGGRTAIQKEADRSEPTLWILHPGGEATFGSADLARAPRAEVGDFRLVPLSSLLVQAGLDPAELRAFSFVAVDGYERPFGPDAFDQAYFDPHRRAGLVVRPEGGDYHLVRDVVAIRTGTRIPLPEHPLPSEAYETGPAVEDRSCPEAREPFSFAVFGDNRPDRFDAPQPAVFRALVEAINRGGVDFVVSTGDMIYGRALRTSVTRRQFEGFLEVTGLLHPRLFFATGNHDLDGAGAETLYRELFGEPHYAFTHKGAYCIVLDTEEAGALGRIRGGQLAWLDERLAESRRHCTRFVFLHRPLFLPPEIERTGRTITPGHDALHRRFRNAGVDAVFAAHIHGYHRMEKEGVVYVITGGAGAPIYLEPDRGGIFHYTRVDVDGDEVRIEAVPVSTP